MKGQLLNAMDVALLVGTTVPTLNTWYKWKQLEPEHELAKLLPDYTTLSNSRVRYWTEADVYKILEFRTKLPKGRNGILGKVTQRYARRKPNENEI